MHVLNIHQRSIPRPTAEVGRLIDTLASDHDRVWPRTLWPAMRFDRPLAVGADGGHGPVRYAVIDHEPGRRVRFIFKAPRGFIGWHELEVLPEDDGTLLRHTIEMNATGPALLTWPLAIRWLHDACLEDAFATAEVSLGLIPTVVPWSPWVKFLRWAMSGGKARPQRIDSLPADMITPIPAPPAAGISSEIPGSHFHDCYVMPLAHGGRSALDIYLKTVSRSPRWVEVMLGLRNRIVAPFGLKNVGHLGALAPLKPAAEYKIGDQVGIFKLLSATDDEVILGETDRHLDVKVSLCKVMRDEREAVAMTTVVHIHNLMGRIYMMVITPMHRIIAPAVMRRATVACRHG